MICSYYSRFQESLDQQDKRSRAGAGKTSKMARIVLEEHTGPHCNMVQNLQLFQVLRKLQIF